MRRIFAVLGVAGLLVAGSLVGSLAMPILFQEGDPRPVLWAIARLELGQQPIVAVTPDGTTLIQRGSSPEPLTGFLAERGWHYQDRMGAATFYENGQERLTAIHRAFTTRYGIFRLHQTAQPASG